MKYQVWKTGVVFTDNVSLCCLVGPAEIKIKVSLPEIYANKPCVLALRLLPDLFIHAERQ